MAWRDHEHSERCGGPMIERLDAALQHVALRAHSRTGRYYLDNQRKEHDFELILSMIPGRSTE